MRALLVALVSLAACDDPKTPTPEQRASLRVPLPDGWRAAAMSGGLQVGPQGRVVLQLESTTRPLPDAATFLHALEAEGVEVLQKESVDTFVGARYSVSGEGTRRDAFVGVRQTGPRTIWCSTTASAKRDEVEAAMTVCRSLSWEG